MAGFVCCLWWFVTGVLLGWLLNWLFDKFFRRGGGSGTDGGTGTGGEYRSTAASRTTASAPQPSAPITPNVPVSQLYPPAAPAPVAATPAPVASVANAVAVASAAAAYGFGKLKTSGGYDNFEIIEGIGPKINDVMHDAGIHSFAALAALDIPAISKILDAAGPNFKLANPETWAQQSSLCATGQWEKLKAWQAALVAGVSIQKDNG